MFYLSWAFHLETSFLAQPVMTFTQASSGCISMKRSTKAIPR